MSIEAPEMANGRVETAPIRVAFGPGKTQNMPLEWAQFMLNKAYELEKTGSKPVKFSELLASAGMEAR